VLTTTGGTQRGIGAAGKHDHILDVLAVSVSRCLAPLVKERLTARGSDDEEG